MTKIQALCAAMSALLLSACEPVPTQSGPVGEPLAGAALENRLADKRVALRRDGSDRVVDLLFYADGRGDVLFRLSKNAKPTKRDTFRWRVQGKELCVLEPNRTPDCARPAISGNNITIRWGEDRNSPRLLSGTISPL